VIPEAAVEAAHAAICEDSLNDCLEWHGRCVKAVEAAAPHMLAEAWDEGEEAGVLNHAAEEYPELEQITNPHRSQV
jgi:hypothetical protein